MAGENVSDFDPTAQKQPGRTFVALGPHLKSGDIVHVGGLTFKTIELPEGQIADATLSVGNKRFALFNLGSGVEESEVP